jgi:hypothetical protein
MAVHFLDLLESPAPACTFMMRDVDEDRSAVV